MRAATDRPPVRLAVLLSELQAVVPEDDLSCVVDLAVHAESVGADAVFVGEHVVMGAASAADGPPDDLRAPLRPGRIPPDVPWLDPFVTLAAVAGATSTIGLGTAVLIAPLRPAVLTAKMAASLDVLSGGRLELGLGVSWQREEYDALGVPFHERGRRLDDALQAWKALWSAGPASHRGSTTSFEDVWCRPQPVRPGGVPLWFGGSFSDRTVRRVVNHGSGLAPLPRADEAQLAALADAMRAAGRDPASLDLITGLRPAFGPAGGVADLHRSLAGVPALVEAGYTTLVLWPAAFAGSADELPDVVTAAVEAFRDAVGEPTTA